MWASAGRRAILDETSILSLESAATMLRRRRFGVWRHRRSRGTRIPEELWQAAAREAREHGVCKTSRHLGVDYYSLKRRLTGSAPAADPVGVEFVEIPQKVLSAGPGCVLELQDPRGSRLRIELRDTAGAESLARALWNLRG